MFHLVYRVTADLLQRRHGSVQERSSTSPKQTRSRVWGCHRQASQPSPSRTFSAMRMAWFVQDKRSMHQSCFECVMHCEHPRFSSRRLFHFSTQVCTHQTTSRKLTGNENVRTTSPVHQTLPACRCSSDQSGQPRSQVLPAVRRDSVLRLQLRLAVEPTSLHAVGPPKCARSVPALRCAAPNQQSTTATMQVWRWPSWTLRDAFTSQPPTQEL